MNEENNKDLSYDFNFENQVTKEEPKAEIKEEVIETFDSLDEEEVLPETSNVTEEVSEDLDQMEEIIEESEEKQDKEPEANAKKIKILNKEFNYEDVVIILIGLIILVAIFLLPKIVKVF